MTFLLLFNRIEYVGLCRHGRVKVDLIRKFLWSNSLLCHLEIGSAADVLSLLFLILVYLYYFIFCLPLSVY